MKWRRNPPSRLARLMKLKRDRDGFQRILDMPQTSFTYRQRLRKAIAWRDREIARLEDANASNGLFEGRRA